MKILTLRRLGDPILRAKAKKLAKSQILSTKTQNLIDNLRYTCDKKNYGVGISAPQVGESLAISVIAIKPTPARPDLVLFDDVLINAEIVKTFGQPVKKWEGCCSVGGPAFENLIYGLVPRYKKMRIKYLDRNAQPQTKIVDGFVAHVVQHEIDHLNGVLFTDLADPKSLMMGDEYQRWVINKKHE
ncbi:MAG: peptide deformylase [Candidatus Nomurabacteria bacterium]|nr:peptide deformylase [Candidatus Nomurabacteria bacterium]